MSSILVDMDGVIVDWGAAYNRSLDSWGPSASRIPRHKDQRSFDLHEGLSKDETYIVDHVMKNLDYFNMTPIEGAIDALQGMLDYGHDVMICTSPWLPNVRCIPDKIQWVKTYLGWGWEDRVVITKDKTVVRGDWLVDDRPTITGRRADPDWTHVLFDQPYNQAITSQPRLMSWSDWDNGRFE